MKTQSKPNRIELNNYENLEHVKLGMKKYLQKVLQEAYLKIFQ